MTALADASEHTGQASAFHQIVLRFADQLDSDDDTSESGAADDASVLDTLRSASASQSLCAKAEKRRSRAQRKAERAQAKNNTADSTSLVDDKNAISMDDVMSYAGGLRPSFGAAADTTSKNVAKVGEWTALRRTAVPIPLLPPIRCPVRCRLPAMAWRKPVSRRIMAI